ncbi:MAG: hypothetical protein ACREFJ_16570, partial [Acetobacteraceae bacterium]
MARPPRLHARRAGADLASSALQSISVEGALIAPAQLARIAAQKDDAATREAYGTPKGLGLREEITRAFRIGQALFGSLQSQGQDQGSAQGSA